MQVTDQSKSLILFFFSQSENTFFNPAQKLNRDISTEIIKTYFEKKENVRILSAIIVNPINKILTNAVDLTLKANSQSLKFMKEYLKSANQITTTYHKNM